jgi:meiotically up-regulated gene 157 (Mug157) protein
MEDLIARMKKVIRDPDLFRLFENSYPNTLDTMIKWRGYAKVKNETTGEETETDEELTYVITGDIDAMWLRDSASQIYSYLPLLEASTKPDSLASLWRGVINLHARYIVISPYCHSFQPPPESGIPPTHNGAYHLNKPYPPYDPKLVFDCKWELDSLASFLQISAAYYARTGDLDFFGRYGWVDAVQAAVDAAGAMRLGTYDDEGRVLPSAWTFTGYTNRGSETLTNNGLGNPVRQNGMVRSAFRPSDDACIFQLLTPSNMMFAAYLEHASAIMQGLAESGKDGRRSAAKAANLTLAMRELAGTIRHGIARDAVVKHRDFGDIFAYEVDGYGGANLMDDANVPSLLALPLWNYTAAAAAADARPPASSSSSAFSSSSSATSVGKTNQTSTPATDADAATDAALLQAQPRTDYAAPAQQHDYAQIYHNTRAFVLSLANPYYAQGPVLSAVGGPHIDPGRGWPMAAIVAGLTAFEEMAGFATPAERQDAVGAQLRAVLGSTAGTGVVHESVDAWNEQAWTRSWFGWANGLFGELVLRIAGDEERRGVLGKEEGLLGRLWQD